MKSSLEPTAFAARLIGVLLSLAAAVLLATPLVGEVRGCTVDSELGGITTTGMAIQLAAVGALLTGAALALDVVEGRGRHPRGLVPVAFSIVVIVAAFLTPC